MKASCRKNSDIFKVRYFDSQYSYPLRDKMLDKVQATTPILANYKRVHTPKDVIEDVKSVYRIEISYRQAWRSNEREL